jgi:hypothetical protein
VDSTFTTNDAEGGNSNSGIGPNSSKLGMVLVGEGLGGAIASGYGGPKATEGLNTIAINTCTFSQNTASGGDKNSGTASASGLVGSGAGGSIANYAGGTATVIDSKLFYGQSQSGENNTSTGTSVFANLGAGGAIFNYLGNSTSTDYGSLGTTSTVTVTNSVLEFNIATGQGGNAEGGGIANVLSAATTLTGSTLSLNQANDEVDQTALGGGIYNDASSYLSLTRSQVTLNLAGGSSGMGGGVYSNVAFVSVKNLIKGNSAADENDIDINP